MPLYIPPAHLVCCTLQKQVAGCMYMHFSPNLRSSVHPFLWAALCICSYGLLFQLSSRSSHLCAWFKPGHHWIIRGTVRTGHTTLCSFQAERGGKYCESLFFLQQTCKVLLEDYFCVLSACGEWPRLSHLSLGNRKNFLGVNVQVRRHSDVPVKVCWGLEDLSFERKKVIEQILWL